MNSTRWYKFVLTAITLALMTVSIERGAALAAPAIFYKQTNLISDQAGKAVLPDDNLLNAWGMAFQPNGAIWVMITTQASQLCTTGWGRFKLW